MGKDNQEKMKYKGIKMDFINSLQQQSVNLFLSMIYKMAQLIRIANY